MEMRVYAVKARFLEDMLGTTPADPTIYKTFIASKAKELCKQEEECETVPDDIDEIERRGYTTFHKNEKGECFIYDYMIRGMLKEAANVKKQFGLMKQLKSKVSQFLFVYPRKIVLGACAPEPIERAVRGQTAQGPRTFLSRSDFIPAGREFSFEIGVLDDCPISDVLIKELLLYAQVGSGLGQWRSASHGRFEVYSFKKLPNRVFEILSEGDEVDEVKPEVVVVKKVRGRKKKEEEVVGDLVPTNICGLHV